MRTASGRHITRLALSVFIGLALGTLAFLGVLFMVSLLGEGPLFRYQGF